MVPPWSLITVTFNRSLPFLKVEYVGLLIAVVNEICCRTREYAVGPLTRVGTPVPGGTRTNLLVRPESVNLLGPTLPLLPTVLYSY